MFLSGTCKNIISPLNIILNKISLRLQIPFYHYKKVFKQQHHFYFVTISNKNCEQNKTGFNRYTRSKKGLTRHEKYSQKYLLYQSYLGYIKNKRINKTI